MVFVKSNLERFLEERNAALFSLDENRIKEYCRKHGLQIPENKKVFWGAIYKSICNITDAPNEVVEIARQRLKEMGWSENIG